MNGSERHERNSSVRVVESIRVESLRGAEWSGESSRVASRRGDSRLKLRVGRPLGAQRLGAPSRAARSGNERVESLKRMGLDSLGLGAQRAGRSGGPRHEFHSAADAHCTSARCEQQPGDLRTARRTLSDSRVLRDGLI